MIPTQKTNMEAANRIKHTREQDTQRFLIPETQKREIIVMLYLAWCLIRTFHLIETKTLLFTTRASSTNKPGRTRCYHRRLIHSRNAVTLKPVLHVSGNRWLPIQTLVFVYTRKFESLIIFDHFCMYKCLQICMHICKLTSHISVSHLEGNEIHFSTKW